MGRETAGIQAERASGSSPEISHKKFGSTPAALERKMQEYLRGQGDQAQSAKGTRNSGIVAGEELQAYISSKSQVAGIVDFSGDKKYFPATIQQVVDAIEEKNKQYGNAIGNNFDFVGSMNRHADQAARVGNKDLEMWLQSVIGVNARAKKQDTTGAIFSKYKNTRGISVDEGYLKMSPEEIKRDLIKQRQDKWTVPGNDTLKSIVDHEYGHSLDNILKLQKNKDIERLFTGKNNQHYRKPSKEEKMKVLVTDKRQKFIKNHLSEYGSYNIEEFIAEGLSEYWNTPKPRFFAKRIGAIMEKQYAAYATRLKKER